MTEFVAHNEEGTGVLFKGMETIPEPSENRFLIDVKERGECFWRVAMARRDTARFISSGAMCAVTDFRLAMLLGSEVSRLEQKPSFRKATAQRLFLQGFERHP